jgi:tocopherol O-methyltransferase
MGATLKDGLVTKRAIRTHYDLATPFYRLLWGRHIHHGLWDGDLEPAQAQDRLVERVLSEAGIAPGSSVLDVGSGMGASAIYLAKNLGCQVQGLTLSSVQRTWSTFAAWQNGVGNQVRFLCRDVEKVEIPAASFDVVWSVECTEHLFDKASFFRRAAGWLRTQGRVAICAWLAQDRPHGRAAAREIRAVCEGFLCPSLGTKRDYLSWMARAGIEDCRFLDLTEQVTRTWEICLERVRQSRVHWVARWAGQSMMQFLNHFETILRAYRTGAMRYGCFVGTA